MTAPDLDRYVQSFQRLDGAGSAAINALRERGLASFTSLGFPSTALEDWKYTNVAPLAEQTFKLPEAAAPNGAGALADSVRLKPAMSWSSSTDASPPRCHRPPRCRRRRSVQSR
jgi:hypothetical protein